jgi:tetraacyldisaccharide 4'-kinase
VCIDRVAGARAAIALGASVIVMDDGMQNPSLAKDITLAVIDGATGVGNGLCIPAGPLRAPLAAQDFSALLVIGNGEARNAVASHIAVGKPTFRAGVVADAQVAFRLSGQTVVAFAGIGRPEKFFETLEQIGARIVARRAFADHHVFTKDDIDQLKPLASNPSHDAPVFPDGAFPILVTTEKDFVRLPTDMRDGVIALPATLAFDDQEGFARWFFESLKKIRASR